VNWRSIARRNGKITNLGWCQGSSEARQHTRADTRADTRGHPRGHPKWGNVRLRLIVDAVAITGNATRAARYFPELDDIALKHNQDAVAHSKAPEGAGEQGSSRCLR
jgi:hypothetical protein